MNVQDQPHVKMAERRSLASTTRPTQDEPVFPPRHLAQNNPRYPRPQQKSMLLLRRPDDHHRDLRARLRAKKNRPTLALVAIRIGTS
jgi:hypothetical protein